MTRLACCILALCALGIALGAAAPPPADGYDYEATVNGLRIGCTVEVTDQGIWNRWLGFSVKFTYCIGTSWHKQGYLCSTVRAREWITGMDGNPAECVHLEANTTLCDLKKISMPNDRVTIEFHDGDGAQQSHICERLLRASGLTVEPQ